jgi:putative transposase
MKPVRCLLVVEYTKRMQYNRLGHAVFYTRYHLVISTKYRRKIFKDGMAVYLKLKVREVQRSYPEIVIHEVNTDIDHMHILLSRTQNVTISSSLTD